MKTSIIFGTILIGSLVMFSTVSAESAFEEHLNQCVSKFANPNDSANIMLECTAGGGKLSDCKVVENNQPNKGFDKAAVCVASSLPVGAKTGTIRVPVRFAGA